MYRNFNAGKRAHSLAWLLVTTSLWPLVVQAEPAKKITELPVVEVVADDSGAGTGTSKEGLAFRATGRQTTPAA